MITEEQLKEASKFVNRTIAGMEGHGSNKTRKGSVFYTLRKLLDRENGASVIVGSYSGNIHYADCPFCKAYVVTPFKSDGVENVFESIQSKMLNVNYCRNCGKRLL